jgi:hypothetical protein
LATPPIGTTGTTQLNAAWTAAIPFNAAPGQVNRAIRGALGLGATDRPGAVVTTGPSTLHHGGGPWTVTILWNNPIEMGQDHRDLTYDTSEVSLESFDDFDDDEQKEDDNGWGNDDEYNDFNNNNTSNNFYASYSAGSYSRVLNAPVLSTLSSVAIATFNSGNVTTLTCSQNTADRVFFGINNFIVIRSRLATWLTQFQSVKIFKN